MQYHNATISTCTVSSEDLVRIENLVIPGGLTIPPEFYVNCAQTKVNGRDNKTWSGAQ